jgi:mannose-6-phosphate isomerase-like protein (cupin superfamily)
VAPLAPGRSSGHGAAEGFLAHLGELGVRHTRPIMRPENNSMFCYIHDPDHTMPLPDFRAGCGPWDATAVTEVLGPGEGHARFEARGSVMYVKALAGLDDGDLSLMERTLPPGGRRPPAHRHTNCSEAYFVLDGQVLVTVEDQDLAVCPEGFVLVPRGTAHTFGNVSDQPARLLVIHAPAMDAYFAALHELWHRDQPPSPDEERALMARFGMEQA